MSPDDMTNTARESGLRLTELHGDRPAGRVVRRMEWDIGDRCWRKSIAIGTASVNGIRHVSQRMLMPVAVRCAWVGHGPWRPDRFGRSASDRAEARTVERNLAGTYARLRCAPRTARDE